MATQNNGYPFNNEIVVEIDGKQHKDWKSYDIDSDFLIPADAFNFRQYCVGGLFRQNGKSAD